MAEAILIIMLAIELLELETGTVCCYSCRIRGSRPKADLAFIDEQSFNA
jgi:hypothetical protein